MELLNSGVAMHQIICQLQTVKSIIADSEIPSEDINQKSHVIHHKERPVTCYSMSIYDREGIKNSWVQLLFLKIKK